MKRPPDDDSPCPDAPPADPILMPTDPTSLTSGERELAERLARLGPHAEPSPAMDARILAAARDAATATRRRPRWPTLLGLAASLLLAVGLAWRLRPLPERPAPPAPTPARTEARAGAPADLGATAPAAMPPAAVASQEAPTDASANEAPQPEIAGAAPMANAQRVDEAMSDRTAPLARDVRPAMKSREASPAPEEPPSPQAFGDAAAPPPPAPPVAPAMPSEPLPGVAGDEAARAASASGDEPELDVPPATADAPEVRDAWLQRIQALVDAGDIEGARASLHAFVARYPDYTLPENLRALAR